MLHPQDLTMAGPRLGTSVATVQTLRRIPLSPYPTFLENVPFVNFQELKNTRK